MRRLGSNQSLIISALFRLQKLHGRKEFEVRQVIDFIWEAEFNPVHEIGSQPDLRMELVARAVGGDKGIAKTMKITDDYDLRFMVRQRATKRGSPTRPWARALERINPTRCFRLLEQAGLVERFRSGRVQMVRLTDEGARAAAFHNIDERTT